MYICRCINLSLSLSFNGYYRPYGKYHFSNIIRTFKEKLENNICDIIIRNNIQHSLYYIEKINCIFLGVSDNEAAYAKLCGLDLNNQQLMYDSIPEFENFLFYNY